MHIYSKKKRQKKAALIVILIALVRMQCWGAMGREQYTFSVELNRNALEELIDATVEARNGGGGIDIAVTLASKKNPIAMAAIIKKKGAGLPLVNATTARGELLDHMDLNVGNRLYGGSWDDDYSSGEESWDDKKLCKAGELYNAAKKLCGAEKLCSDEKSCGDEKSSADEYVVVSLTIGVLEEYNKNQ